MRASGTCCVRVGDDLVEGLGDSRFPSATPMRTPPASVLCGMSADWIFSATGKPISAPRARPRRESSRATRGSPGFRTRPARASPRTRRDPACDRGSRCARSGRSIAERSAPPRSRSAAAAHARTATARRSRAHIAPACDSAGRRPRRGSRRLRAPMPRAHSTRRGSGHRSPSAAPRPRARASSPTAPLDRRQRQADHVDVRIRGDQPQRLAEHVRIVEDAGGHVDRVVQRRECGHDRAQSSPRSRGRAPAAPARLRRTGRPSGCPRRPRS